VKGFFSRDIESYLQGVRAAHLFNASLKTGARNAKLHGAAA
jgi:hypothetical protein